MAKTDMRVMQGPQDDVETTVEIVGFSYDEVEERVYGGVEEAMALSRVSVDLLVHGTRDGSRVFVTGNSNPEELISLLNALGLRQ